MIYFYYFTKSEQKDIVDIKLKLNLAIDIILKYEGCEAINLEYSISKWKIHSVP